MTTTIRTHEAGTVQLHKTPGEPLWGVVLRDATTGNLRQLGRITRAAGDLWMAERGFGWDDFTTRKAAIDHLIQRAS